jgi:hypothetical protein
MTFLFRNGSIIRDIISLYTNFLVTTLGQPMEVLKTHVRNDIAETSLPWKLR